MFFQKVFWFHLFFKKGERFSLLTFFFHKKKVRENAASRAAFHTWQLLCLVLALLVCDTAAGLAGALAGSLALAASAVLCALAEIACLDSLDMLHNK